MALKPYINPDTFVHPEAIRFKNMFEEERKRLAEVGKVFGPNDSGYSGWKTNIAYYSKGGEGYESALRDIKLNNAAIEIQAKNLGITPEQLVANPQLATDPEALAKYTGRTYNGVSYAPGTPAWAALQSPQAGPVPTTTVTPGGTTTTPTTTTTPGGTATTTNVGSDKPPEGVAFTNSAAYKALSPELQSLVNLGYNVFFEGGEAEAAVFADSLTKAQALADPYAKAQLGMAKAEIGLATSKLSSDYESSKKILDRTRKELAEDLSIGKDAIALNEQADMARALRGYDEDMLTIADQAAEKGITFATGARSREEAESRRDVQYQDVVQSTRRTSNLKVKELELRAARGDQDAIDKLSGLESSRGFKLKEIGQKAEEVLGSMGAKDLNLEGFAPSGGVLGSIEQDRRKSIIDIASTGIELAK